MKFTIFSTLFLGFSSAALAAPQSIEDTHQLVEREPEPKARLEARLSYPGCKTNSGYCSYNYNTAACICT
ncbi:hypothetical protein CRV24_000224 [Beauveria bassiana]|nr:hypothetical protein CRV24_000224 [Beauveria bassiana]